MNDHQKKVFDNRILMGVAILSTKMTFIRQLSNWSTPTVEVIIWWHVAFQKFIVFGIRRLVIAYYVECLPTFEIEINNIKNEKSPHRRAQIHSPLLRRDTDTLSPSPGSATMTSICLMFPLILIFLPFT